MKKFFQSVTSVEEAKKLYRKLTFTHHPDRGGDTETMQQINREYDDLMSKGIFSTQSAEFDQQAANEAFRNIIDGLVNFDGLDIEIIGTWIWVTGNTYAAKDKLKEMGFKWANQKKAWVWHEGEYKKVSKKDYSLDECRSMHGSKTVKKNPKGALV